MSLWEDFELRFICFDGVGFSSLRHVSGKCVNVEQMSLVIQRQLVLCCIEWDVAGESVHVECFGRCGGHIPCSQRSVDCLGCSKLSLIRFFSVLPIAYQ